MRIGKLTIRLGGSCVYVVNRDFDASKESRVKLKQCFINSNHRQLCTYHTSSGVTSPAVCTRRKPQPQPRIRLGSQRCPRHHPRESRRYDHSATRKLCDLANNVHLRVE